MDFMTHLLIVIKMQDTCSMQKNQEKKLRMFLFNNFTSF